LVAFKFIFCSVTTFANREWLAFFDPYDRNKKNVQVVVNSGFIRLLQTADSATSRVILNDFGFG